MGLDLFTPRTPAVIGLDVDDSSIRMVELSRTKNGLSLERYAVEQLPQGAISDHSVVEKDVVFQALVACRKKLNSKIKNAAAAVPSSSIQTMRARVTEGMREDEIDMIVMAEVNNKSDASIEQTSVDYQTLEFHPGQLGEPGENELLIATCGKEKVEERISLVEASGLKALIVDSDLLSMIDAIEKSIERQGESIDDKLFLLINMTHRSTYFYFVKNGQVVHDREHPFGTEQLSQEIGVLYDTDAQTGDRIRLGLKKVEDSSNLVRAKENFVEVTAQEAARAIQLFLTATNHSAVSSVVLLGNGVSLPNMASTLQRVLGVPCQIGNPFAGMTISSNVDSKQLFIDAPALAVACGLALRRFDK